MGNRYVRAVEVEVEGEVEGKGEGEGEGDGEGKCEYKPLKVCHSISNHVILYIQSQP